MQRLLIATVGLPGSGKTTWAKEQVQLWLDRKAPNTIRVNRDEIRREWEAATGWQWSQENERDVIAERDKRIRNAFSQGYEIVISDDTNLAAKSLKGLEEVARGCKAEFEIKSFLHVYIGLCIERDSKREGKARVGEEVIRRMARQYNIGNEATVQPTFAPYVGDKSLPAVVICDLDGTLANNGGHRGIYDFEKCAGDSVNPAVLATLNALRFQGLTKIVFLTGREEKYREQTEEFLDKATFKGWPLIMRSTGDFRKDWIIKGELFDKHIRGVYNVLFCLDDRDQVVKFYRSLGLTVFQVAEGNF